MLPDRTPRDLAAHRVQATGFLPWPHLGHRAINEPVARTLICILLIGAALTPSHRARSEPPLREAKRFQVAGGLEVWPLPLLNVRVGANITPHLSIDGWIGPMLLANRFEIDAKGYVGDWDYSPYVYVGGAFLWRPFYVDEGGHNGNLSGALVGLGFEAARWSGHVLDIHVCVYVLQHGTGQRPLCPGGGFSFGMRW